MDWIYFTDCGCKHVQDLIAHFRNAYRKSGDSIVAICDAVAGKGRGCINRYMTDMEILNPSFEKELGPDGEKIPQAITTTNALVYAPASHQLDGFSTAFGSAGGEDLDFGIRLRELGRLAYEPCATVYHDLMRISKTFSTDLNDTVEGTGFLSRNIGCLRSGQDL